jgi:hypothetical protein
LRRTKGRGGKKGGAGKRGRGVKGRGGKMRVGKGGSVPGVGGGERLGPRKECNDPPYISQRHGHNRSVVLLSLLVYIGASFLISLSSTQDYSFRMPPSFPATHLAQLQHEHKVSQEVERRVKPQQRTVPSLGPGVHEAEAHGLALPDLGVVEVQDLERHLFGFRGKREGGRGQIRSFQKIVDLLWCVCSVGGGGVRGGASGLWDVYFLRHFCVVYRFSMIYLFLICTLLSIYLI